MSSNIVDLLRVEGVMAQGYGMIPKTVVRDQRLTPEAKAIYSYLSSFAGAGNQAFPARELMLQELGMSSNRYYRHFKKLLECDYIHVEQMKATGNLFSKNIYILVAQPDCKVKPENVDEKVNPILEAKPSSEEVKKSSKICHIEKRASVQALRQRLEIDQIKQQIPEQEACIEEVFLAIEDLAICEQVTIAGTTRNKEAIDSVLEKLMPDHIRLVANTISKNKKKLINRKAYIQACIINSIFDINNIPSLPASNLEETSSSSKDSDSKKESKLLLAKQYEQCPDLREVDRQIDQINLNLSRAILAGNEIMWNKLKLEKKHLEQERETLLKAVLPDTSF